MSPRQGNADRPRYEVQFPIDIGTRAGSGHTLEEAGREFLAVPGATSIWDCEEKRYIDPLDIPVVAEYAEHVRQVERIAGTIEQLYRLHPHTPEPEPVNMFDLVEHVLRQGAEDT